MAVSRIASDDQIFVRGPAHAQNIFGLNNEFLLHTPKLQFENFIRFNFGSGTQTLRDHVKNYLPIDQGDLEHVAAFVKTADYPSMQIETDTLNQYNKKRIIQKKIAFDPITITMHDSADGKSLRFWEMYYNWFYKDGNKRVDAEKGIFASDKDGTVNHNNNYVLPSDFTSDDNGVPIIEGDATTHNEYGFNIHSSKEHLFKSIEIFYSRAKHYSKVVLLNPKITAFKHDKLDYSGSAATMELTFTIQYENVIYGNTLYELTAGGDLKKIPDATMPVINKGKIGANPLIANSAMTDSSGALETAGTDQEDVSITQSINNGITDLFGDSALGSSIGKIATNTVSNVEGQLTGIVDNLGNDITNSLVRGIQTGNFKLQPDPIKSAKNAFGVGSGLKKQVIGQTTSFVGKKVGGFVLDTIFGSNSQAGSGNSSGQTKGGNNGQP